MLSFATATQAVTPAQDPLSSGSIILTILVLVGVLVAAYYTTRFISTKMMKSGISSKKSGRSSGKKTLGKYVNIVDRAQMDREKGVVVVEFEGKFYLLGVSPQGVNLIDKQEISEEEYAARRKEEEEEAAAREQAAGAVGFVEIFKQQFKQKFSGKKNTRVKGQNPDKVDFKEELDIRMDASQGSGDKQDKDII